jgi:hypothetical protein
MNGISPKSWGGRHILSSNHHNKAQGKDHKRFLTVTFILFLYAERRWWSVAEVRHDQCHDSRPIAGFWRQLCIFCLGSHFWKMKVHDRASTVEDRVLFVIIFLFYSY